MAAGFQVFNADGTLQFDTSNRLFRALSTFNTTTVDGSIVIPGISAAGIPVFYVTGQINYTAPNISISGDTVSWVFDTNSTVPNSAVSVIIFSR